MAHTFSYAAHGPDQPLVPFRYSPRPLGAHDVRIRVHYCGICHSDIHQARGEWGGSSFPMVPGHEIAGTVIEAGQATTRHAVGARVGVGCFVDSCRSCGNCHDDLEQFCDQGMTPTYNGTHRDGSTPTYGGYSNEMVVDERYVLRLADSLPFREAAPLLCAGITTYSPLKHWGAGPGKRVAIVGLGGLGHMAVKIAKAFGAEVTVISHSNKKEADAKRLGASAFVSTASGSPLDKLAKQFDIVLNTVSDPTNWNQLIACLKRDGVMVLVGMPPAPVPVHAGALIGQRRRLTGSMIGGIAETQEMLDFCAKHGIACDVEEIAPEDINRAYERVMKSDVRYRFVIDTQKLAAS